MEKQKITIGLRNFRQTTKLHFKLLSDIIIDNNRYIISFVCDLFYTLVIDVTIQEIFFIEVI